MAAGLRISRPGVGVVFNLTADLLKMLGVASIGNSYTGATASGTITDARLTAYPGCTPFVMLLNGGTNIRGYYPVITFAGNNLNWVFPRSAAGTSTRPDVTFLYGLR